MIEINSCFFFSAGGIAVVVVVVVVGVYTARRHCRGGINMDIELAIMPEAGSSGLTQRRRRTGADLQTVVEGQAFLERGLRRATGVAPGGDDDDDDDDDEL